MVPTMKRFAWHKPHLMAVRIFCLVLMAALSANPILAAVNTVAECGRQCCCYSDTRHEAIRTVNIDSGNYSGCCGPAGISPCHMSDGSMPETPLALIHTAERSPVDPISLLLNPSPPAAKPEAFKLPISWGDAGPEFNPSPLYLKTCRLIC